MSLANFVLLPSTEGQTSVTGSPVRASGSFRNSGHYTVEVLATEMAAGQLYIEGSLDGQPVNFFNVLEIPYVDFATNGDDVITLTFEGNFTWVRARLVRTTSVGFIEATVSIDAYIPSVGSPSGGGNGTTTGFNLGNGVVVFSSLTGNQLNFKTLVPGSGISLSPSSNSVLISALPPTLYGLNGFSGAAANGVVISQANTVSITSSPVNNTVFAYRSNAYTWIETADFGAEFTSAIAAQRDGASLSNSISAINVIGADASVDISGVFSIDFPTVEFVHFKYSPGGAGNLTGSDVLVERTYGDTMTIVDAANIIVAFNFTGKSYPPASISVMGQVYQTNEFIYGNVSPSLATRKIAGGGTSASPTLMGAFEGPITLQLRMTDIGASAGPGQRSHGVVMFRF